ncbi:MAG: ion transporter [Bacteroidetes bacterium]|nr:ion transporter [Bacteroidota bacterium]
MAKRKNPKELGFGTLAAANSQRIMNTDGTANVSRHGDPRWSTSDILHKLTVMSWSRFFFIVFINYLAANLVFAVFYYITGVQHLGITPSGNPWMDFLEAFFFSTQAFTTIGFGRVNPQGTMANILSSLEGLVGLLSFALATGLMYGRFSRPRAQLVHSEHMLMAPYRATGRAIMFRIASRRKHSLLIENSVSVSLGINQMEDGALVRRFYVLDLELDRINFLTTSWTLVHPVVPGSPLYGMSYDEIVDARAEFIVLFKAIEETNSQTVFEKFSYFTDNLIWAARFLPAFGSDKDGKRVLLMDKIGAWEAAELPELQKQAAAEDELPEVAGQA